MAGDDRARPGKARASFLRSHVASRKIAGEEGWMEGIEAKRGKEIRD